MKSTVLNIFFGFLLTFAISFSAFADEVTEVIDDVAAKLVQQLPMDKKIALKSLSPDETGLPEDFLRKLTSDLEAALLTASEFEINLANRATMEDVWQEAVEFNNADFEELFKSANADVMLMMSPRAISTGVEIAITAYSLTGDNVGKTLASSGSVLLPIDLQANLGVDVNDLNKQMMQVLAEIEKVGQTGGLISNPNTYAEFYHNARLLQQRGEVDLAINNYLETLRVGKDNSLPFFDPLLDLIDLVIARYGESSAPLFFERQIGELITPEMREYLEFRFSKITQTEMRYRITSDLVSPMALNYWIKSYGRSLYNDRISQLNPNARLYGESNISDDYTILAAARTLLRAIQNGYFSDYFIDDIRAVSFVDEEGIRGIEANLNRVEVSLFSTQYIYGKSEMFLDATSYAKSRFPESEVGKGVAKLRMEFSPSNNDIWHFSTLKTQESYIERALRGQNSVSLISAENVIGTDEFSYGAWCAEKRRFPLEDFWNSIVSVSNLDFANEPYKSLSGEREYIVPPVNVFTDRIVWADVCADLRFPNTEYNIGDTVPVWGLHNLVITDDVDRTKPIVLTLETPKSCNLCLPYARVDLSKDGTYLWDMGVPSATYFAPMDSWYQHYQMNTNVKREACTTSEDSRINCDEFGEKVVGNNWLYAPGIIQSAIYTRRLVSVSYTTLSGEFRTVDNIYFNASGYASRDINGSTYEVDGIERIIGAASQLGYSKAAYGGTNVDFGFRGTYQETERTKFPVAWSYFFQPTISRLSVNTRLESQSALSCAVSSAIAKITNVQNFTNLRQQAGLNGRVIGQVPLGATVSVVNPGSFLRYDRCATACNGTNQNAIKQCIYNNDVWIEVDYNGRRGFLSRKFLD